MPSSLPGPSRLPVFGSALATLLATLAALVGGTPGLFAQEQDVPVGPDTYQLVKQVVEILRADDGPALADLVDFELRLEEGSARGTAERRWADLDDIDRMIERQATTQRWLGDDPAFLRDARLVSVSAVTDPDAGRGPVPDRSVARAKLQSLRTRMVRDMLVVTTPAGSVLDLIFGNVHVDGANPAGPNGLQPSPLPGDQTGDLRWPAEMLADEQESVRELVDELVESAPGEQRARIAERLHRNPRPAVAALVERLVEVDDGPDPDADVQQLLDDTLTLISGRSSSFAVAPRAGLDLSSWRARNSAEIAGWVRWVDGHVESFVPTEIVSPLVPTFAEGRDADAGKSGDESRWAAALASKDDESAPLGAAGRPDRPDRSIAGRKPETTGGTADPTTPSPSNGAPGAGSDAPAPWTPPERKIKGLDGRVAKPPTPQGPGPRDLLFTAAADMPLRLRGKRVTGRDIEQDLSPQLREALNTWAEVAVAHELEVLIGNSPDALVLGVAKDRLLEDASAWMDRVDELYGSVVPLVEGRTANATVALLFDEKGVRSDGYAAVVDALEEQRVVFSSLADDMRAEPSSVTLRGVPLFVQITFDAAGNAAAGDDEFRLRNEVLNKTVQCLVTNRVGQLPAAIRWGLGYVAEVRETDAVYTFDMSGFVATADHFDWPVRTRQHLEKRDKRRGYRISSEPVDGAVAGKAEPPQMIVWGALDYLTHREPASLAGLLQQLGALQNQLDPRSRASAWKGGTEATASILAEHFDLVDAKGLISHLKRID